MVAVVVDIGLSVLHEIGAGQDPVIEDRVERAPQCRALARQSIMLVVKQGQRGLHAGTPRGQASKQQFLEDMVVTIR